MHDALDAVLMRCLSDLIAGGEDEFVDVLEVCPSRTSCRAGVRAVVPVRSRGVMADSRPLKGLRGADHPACPAVLQERRFSRRAKITQFGAGLGYV
jgi:hypothetical protein